MTAAPDTPRPAYGSLEQPRAAGGLIGEVEAGSPAADAGLAPGDVVLTAEGLALRDVIDWQWNADGPEVELLVEREGKRRETVLRRGPGRTWGLSFAQPVFDRVRTCRNDCAFCFTSQLPRGLRPSLYLRDDDFRLSFLSGTFITLTNLTDADVARILTQRLSPLHVSLHAVTPEVRARLICARGEDLALERFDELTGEGIEVHVQIVLVPDVNDGDELQKTLRWLAERGEAVASVGVVPLGYTRHQTAFTGSYGEPGPAAAVLDALAPWQDRMRRDRALTWVQAADELYLAAGRPVPAADSYDGYPQYENGIGMVRAFMDEWREAVAELAPVRSSAGAASPEAEGPARTILTGELFAPVLRRLLGEAPAVATARVLAVPNALFGGNVSVTGLLAGADIRTTVARDEAEGPVLVPDVIFNDDGLTLDDMTLDDLRAGTDRPVHLLSSTAASLARALAAAGPNPEP